MYAVDETGQPIGILHQNEVDEEGGGVGVGGFGEQDTTDLNKDGSPDVELTEE